MVRPIVVPDGEYIVNDDDFLYQRNLSVFAWTELHGRRRLRRCGRWCTSEPRQRATSCAKADSVDGNSDDGIDVTGAPSSSSATSAMMVPIAAMRSGRTPMLRHPMRTSVGLLFGFAHFSQASQEMVSCERESSSAICWEFKPSFRSPNAWARISSILDTIVLIGG